jgi:hypothetical protein
LIIIFLKCTAKVPNIPILGIIVVYFKKNYGGFMLSQKPAESQGVRLLRQLFLNGKRVFDMKDVATAATIF